jgi:hypothetical protein
MTLANTTGGARLAALVIQAIRSLIKPSSSGVKPFKLSSPEAILSRKESEKLGSGISSLSNRFNVALYVSRVILVEPIEVR